MRPDITAGPMLRQVSPAIDGPTAAVSAAAPDARDGGGVDGREVANCFRGMLSTAPPPRAVCAASAACESVNGALSAASARSAPADRREVSMKRRGAIAGAVVRNRRGPATRFPPATMRPRYAPSRPAATCSSPSSATAVVRASHGPRASRRLHSSRAESRSRGVAEPRRSRGVAVSRCRGVAVSRSHNVAESVVVAALPSREVRLTFF